METQQLIGFYIITDCVNSNKNLIYKNILLVNFVNKT